MQLKDNPQLMAEWDFEKNISLSPERLALHSHKKAWWKCPKGHSYEMTLHRKAAGAGCPYCSSHRVLAGYNDLQTLFPSIALEWNYQKNKELFPNQCTAHSNKKVWWKCAKGHEYETTINHRTAGGNCPYCSNHKVLTGYNDLKTLFPHIASEWDTAKNGSLQPTDIVPKTKRKIWWKCTTCGHSWQTSAIDRVYGTGCPVCSLKKRGLTIQRNSLKRNGCLNDPLLLKEWNYDKNLGLSPEQCTAHSNKKVWWKCPKGHEYQCTIDKRSLGQGCPICSNHQLLVGFNDLQSQFPEIAAEWDISKNNVPPTEVVASSTKKAWWTCANCGHPWQTRIRYRTNRESGCPICSANKRIISHRKSFIEKNGCLKDPLLLKEWNYEKNEALTPEQVTACSNQSVWWICSQCKYEWKAKISNRNILKRGCPVCSNHLTVSGRNDLATTHPYLAQEWHPTKNGSLTPQVVPHGTAKKVWWKCPQGHEYKASILHRSHGTGCPICNSGRQTSFAEQAVFFYLRKLYPDAINRYKDIFNNGMELDIYIPSLKIGIEYDGMFYHKPSKLNRELKKYRICQKNHIQLIRLREGERDPEGIGNTPYDWSLHVPEVDKSKKALDRLIFLFLDLLEYTILLKPRCSYPSQYDINTERDKYQISQYMTALKKDSLAELRPDLVQEWHPTKNGNLRPDMFKVNSSRKIWWQCRKCKNEWEAVIGSRATGTGCPLCGIEKSAALKRKAIEMLDPHTKEVLATFISISDASRKLKINSSNISMACKGQRPKAGGYCWRYKE